MLLIIEALLLILAALGQDHRADTAEDVYPLDMALNSVDDQYDGCRKNMANLVETTYLKKELKDSEAFNSAWKKADVEFIKPDNVLTKNHVIAIHVYTDSQVFNDFNKDTRSGKQNYKKKTYKWYSLYFLLTDAIQILNKTQNKCYYTYRGTKVKFNEVVKNQEVRFGSFASSSLNIKRAKFFGTVSCFEIYTCEGANVSKYSKLSHEEEVLIPPYEKFKVTAVKTKGQEGAWCDTVFTLKSTGRESALNCALFKKPRKSVKNYYVVH